MNILITSENGTPAVLPVGMTNMIVYAALDETEKNYIKQQYFSARMTLDEIRNYLKEVGQVMAAEVRGEL